MLRLQNKNCFYCTKNLLMIDNRFKPLHEAAKYIAWGYVKRLKGNETQCAKELKHYFFSFKSLFQNNSLSKISLKKENRKLKNWWVYVFINKISFNIFPSDIAGLL